jgi:DMSO/TMAO reductase YedYZ molybdopterin-dependent catalytic subunit
MKNEKGLPRRRFLAAAGSVAASLGLASCDDNSNDWFENLLDSAEGVTRRFQRAITGRQTLAREYTEADLTPNFKVNGTAEPKSAAYQALAQNGFADWRLEIGGLVERSVTLSLAELRALPARTQITRHDCVEGWSQIGKWTGVRLGPLLDKVGIKDGARYVMFFCADALDLSGDLYYESIDLDGAYHPQTILAYDMNDQPLSIGHGAPLRLRDERQLGYKMAKYVMRIELVDSYARFGKGRGGYWEDRGYEWYAGI